MATKEYYESLLSNPNVQRGLGVLRATEGTARYSNPYAVTFGGRRFDYTKGHPNTRFAFRTKSGKRQYTTAHGAYQFLGSTWGRVASRLGLRDMSPRNQDIAALALIDGRRGLKALVDGDVRTFVNRVGPEWASLPTAPKSYDQPTRGWSFVESAWNNTPVAAVASLPTIDPNAGMLARSAMFAELPSIPTQTETALALPDAVQTASLSPTAGLLMDTYTPPASPVAPVERAALPGPNVAQSYQGFSRAMGMPNAAPVATVERAALPDLPSQRVAAAMTAPTARAPAPDLASFRSMASMPSYAAMTQPSLQQQMDLSPVAMPASPPSVPAPVAPVPTPTPAPQPVAAPAMPASAPAPAQQASRAPSGFDVWDGTANFGIAQGGYELTRLDDGNIARYSPQFDRTTVVDQNNNVQRSFQGRIDGPVGQKGVNSSPFGGVFSAPSTDLGGFVRGGLGGMAGGMAGNVLGGPIGGLLGAALGRNLATGGLRGGRRSNRSDRAAFDQLERMARAGRMQPVMDISRATVGGFPAAPPSARGGRSYGDFDFDGASDISPEAAEAARGGKAGLF